MFYSMVSYISCKNLHPTSLYDITTRVWRTISIQHYLLQWLEFCVCKYLVTIQPRCQCLPQHVISILILLCGLFLHNTVQSWYCATLILLILVTRLRNTLQYRSILFSIFVPVQVHAMFYLNIYKIFSITLINSFRYITNNIFNCFSVKIINNSALMCKVIVRCNIEICLI